MPGICDNGDCLMQTPAWGGGGAAGRWAACLPPVREGLGHCTPSGPVSSPLKHPGDLLGCSGACERPSPPCLHATPCPQSHKIPVSCPALSLVLQIGKLRLRQEAGSDSNLSSSFLPPAPRPAMLHPPQITAAASPGPLLPKPSLVFSGHLGPFPQLPTSHSSKAPCLGSPPGLPS